MRAVLLCAIALVGCARADPAAPPLPGIEITLQALPLSVRSGDTVSFAAVAHNRTSERIQVGHECGPAMDVFVTAPNGATVSVLLSSLPPNGAFTCELGPYHFADAFDSLTNRYSWVAPARAGRYRAFAGARMNAGLSTPSRPLFITVTP
jgi:hypothetical protein